MVLFLVPSHLRDTDKLKLTLLTRKTLLGPSIGLFHVECHVFNKFHSRLVIILHVSQEGKSLEARGTLKLVSSVMGFSKVLDTVSVNGAAVATNVALVRHFTLQVLGGHVLDQQVTGLGHVATNLAPEGLFWPQMNTLDMHLQQIGRIKHGETKDAMDRVQQVDGGHGAMGVQGQVVHKVNVVVHIQLALRTLEGHISFEL